MNYITLRLKIHVNNTLSWLSESMLFTVYIQQKILDSGVLSDESEVVNPIRFLVLLIVIVVYMDSFLSLRISLRLIKPHTRKYRKLVF